MLRSVRTSVTGVVSAGLLFGFFGAFPAAASTPAAGSTSGAAAAAGTEQTVSFAGVSVQVPAAWPVITVDGVPGCVRYDRNAVYLGSPTESTCPARVIGHTATVQILRPAPGAKGSPRGASSAPTVRADTTSDLTIAGADGTRVLLTADPSDPSLVTSIAADLSIGGVTVGRAAVANATASASAPTGPTTNTSPGSAPKSAPQSPESVSPKASGSPVTLPPFTGGAFDACSAPSLTQIDAWADSPYRGVGVYVGGINRGCDQPNLTSSWVSAMARRGWHLLPVYVGLQAPCAGFANAITPAQAAQQGTAAANDAVAQMASLGLGTGNVVYLDMESWDNTNASCTSAVMTFTDAWTVGLHAAGYLSGFYSSASTGVTALVATVQNQSSFHAPDAVWFARWDGKAITTDSALPAALWAKHQRAKQYQGPHDETYGGRKINIDSDVVDGPATPTTPALTTASLPTAPPNVSYSVTLAAAGGVPPYSYAVTGGALPAGLTLSAAGTISGTPTTMAAPTSVTITVTDAIGGTGSTSYSLTVTFVDVPTSNTFFDDIAWLANSGVTGGYADGTFRPTTAVSRQSMAAFLYRYAHDGTDAGACATGESPFTDVADTSPFCGDIAWLASTGITGGYTDGTFRPTVTVSRQSMAAFLHRLDQQ